ncbi:hypothetical protein I6F26_13680 [Ensifer sp. IC3342]|nr:hypothetical protein [Ensifer sp. BRP08]MCA1447629.1 hypothetical protein [Ensifer sp. IC3342]
MKTRAMAFVGLIRFLAALGALSFAAPAAGAEPSRADVEKVFDAFLTCRAEFFDLLASRRADFPAKEFRAHENFTAPVWTDARLVPFSGFVNAYGLPLSGYIQIHKEAAEGPGLMWGFRVNRRPVEVVKLIETRLPGAKFAQMGANSFELRLEPTRAEATWGRLATPKETYRELLVDEADSPKHSFVFCNATEDRMPELKTDDRTGRKRLPPTTSLFVLPKTVSEEDVLEEFSQCRPEFFATLARAKGRFGKVTIEPLFVTAPDGRAGEVSGSTVTFAEPVRAFGLDLVGYTQMLHTKDGKPVSFWWGFRTTEYPVYAAHWLSTRAESLGAAQRIGWGEWVLETRPRTNADADAAEEDLAYRVFKVEPFDYPNLTNVLCGLTADMTGEMKALPDPADLFKQ